MYPLNVVLVGCGNELLVLVRVQSDDFRQALESIATLHGLVPTTNKVISVAGVTGGCGTTTIAINLAYELAHLHPFRVVLAELSLQMGKLADTLNASDQVVLVGQQKVPAIRALQMVSASLQDKAPYLVLNRYDPGMAGFQ